MSEADGRTLLERLANTERALADDATAAKHFAPLVSSPVEVVNFRQLPGAVPGLAWIIPPRPDGSVPETTALLKFADMTRADAVRALADKTFGPPDPACSDAVLAHWSLKPGLSVSWRAFRYDTVDVELSVVAADPADVNCARSSAPPNGRIDGAAMAAFFGRLRAEPLPFRDVAAMEAWLKPYGKAELSQTNPCSASLLNPAPVAPPGMIQISANLELCAVLPESRPFGSRPSRLFVGAGDADMFGRERTAKAAETVFGPRHAACSNADRDVWAIADDTTLVLTPLYRSFGLLVVNGPASMLADCAAP